jgi:hypothetical protein
MSRFRLSTNRFYVDQQAVGYANEGADARGPCRYQTNGMTRYRTLSAYAA